MGERSGMSRRGLFGFLARPHVDYDAVTEQVRATFDAGGHEALYRALEPLARALAEAAGVAPGDRVLDVGAGDGNVALACSAAGAAVDACDLSPRTVMAGLARTGQAIRWSQGDVQVLPYDDGAFGVVTSGFGAALAPRPRRAARELARVLRPGGRLVMTAWTPDGLPGELDALRAELAPLPRGVRFPSDWGMPEVAEERLAPHFDEIAAELRTAALRFGSEEACFDALTRPLGLPAPQRDALRPGFDALLGAWDGEELAVSYLLISARRP